MREKKEKKEKNAVNRKKALHSGAISYSRLHLKFSPNDELNLRFFFFFN